MNAYLTDKNLSLRAKGMLSYLLYLAKQENHYDLSLEFVLLKVQNNTQTFYSSLYTINELENRGYVQLSEGCYDDGREGVSCLIFKDKAENGV
jgi:hypothetical protein